MTPDKILVMRHAEKPNTGGDIHLAPEGATRAQHLVTYIPSTFGSPQFLVATQQSVDSNRPWETIEPLAQSIGVKIDDSFADDDYKALAAEILANQKYQGGLVLVCWHHEKIPKLAQALGAPRAAIPDPWNPNIYNLILILDYTGDPKPSVSKVFEPF